MLQSAWQSQNFPNQHGGNGREASRIPMRNSENYFKIQNLTNPAFSVPGSPPIGVPTGPGSAVLGGLTIDLFCIFGPKSLPEL